MYQEEDLSDLIVEVNQNKVCGENGCMAYGSTNSELLNLFFKLTRDAAPEVVSGMVRKVMEGATPFEMADLFVLAFQTRDCRGGKGEKKLFYTMLLELYKTHPETVLALLGEVSEFGYYKDLILLSEAATGNGVEGAEVLMDLAAALFAERLEADKAMLDAAKAEGQTPTLSLASKFAPREGKLYKPFRQLLMKKLFPEMEKVPSCRAYRKLVTELSAALEVPEVLMAAQRFDEINFAKVPSLCLNRNRKAFLNETSGMTFAHRETGNRLPEDLKRVACRQNLLKSMLLGKVSGKVLMPHELVTQVGRTSETESMLLDAQWSTMRAGVVEQMAKFAGNAEAQAGSIDLGKLVPLVDVSGSMSGIPMEVAIALGILVSELTHPHFKDRFITFESNPRWVSFEGANTLKEKVSISRSAPWGGSTNFVKALELILSAVVEARLSPEEIPDMIVFSDMQFNQASETGEPMHLTIDSMFAEAGMAVCGRPYRPPRIIFWNLSGNTVGFPQTADASNVQMISGFSPSLLKLLLSGEPLVAEEVGTDGVVTRRSVTPYETLRKALDEERYNRIRDVLASHQENRLCGYSVPQDEATSKDA